MDEKLFHKLVHERKEKDCFDFKSSLKLYQANGKLVDNQHDELIKDILGMVFGQNRQEDILAYLTAHFSPEKLRTLMNDLRIDLSPPNLLPPNQGS